MQLFVERARLRRHNLQVTEANAPVLGRICLLLDGLPLALELAAVRVGVLGLAQLAARLEQPLALLTGGDLTADTRHITLRATLDWSYALLGEAEQTLLNRLSVFAGGLDLEAVEAIGDRGQGTGAGRGGREPVLRTRHPLPLGLLSSPPSPYPQGARRSPMWPAEPLPLSPVPYSLRSGPPLPAGGPVAVDGG
ncbi:MAG: hypothetical protein ACR2PL_22030 [Dehalococcoidia bacterium]